VSTVALPFIDFVILEWKHGLYANENAFYIDHISVQILWIGGCHSFGGTQ
jgi:hypothetical protein